MSTVETTPTVDEPAAAVEQTETCRLCNGSGRIAVGPWGARPEKTECPECHGARTLPVGHAYADAGLLAPAPQPAADTERVHPCCKHCTEDPEYHAENPAHSHTVRCDRCGDYAEGYAAGLAAAPAADTERALAAQWADYFEQWDQSVGVEPLTPSLMCRILRGPKPFGIARGEEA